MDRVVLEGVRHSCVHHPGDIGLFSRDFRSKRGCTIDGDGHSPLTSLFHFSSFSPVVPPHDITSRM